MEALNGTTIDGDLGLGTWDQTGGLGESGGVGAVHAM